MKLRSEFEMMQLRYPQTCKANEHTAMRTVQGLVTEV